MKKFILLLAMLLLLSSCTFISTTYTGVRQRPVYRGTVGYGFTTPMWFYSYMYGYYPYWLEYRHSGSMGYHIRSQVIKRRQLAQRPQSVIYKTTTTTKTGTKIKVTGKVVKKK